MPSPILELRSITKRFPGVVALDSTDLDLRPGECHAVAGENGAGKSTLMNIVAGIFKPDAGEILMDNAPVHFADPAAAARAGIGIVFQELSLAPGLSIAENIFANRQPVRAANFINWRQLNADTRRLLDIFDLDLDPATPVRELSAARRQLVEILKALSRNPRIVVLDEPTSSLSEPEKKLLFGVIRRLKAEGVAFIYISHHLSELFAISDRITVMRDGRRVETLNAAHTDEAAIVRRMVGRELQDLYGKRRSEIGAAILALKNCSRLPVLDGISFAARRGEILGIAGLVGAGRTDLGRAIAGIDPFTSGGMLMENSPFAPPNPAAAFRRGVAYLTEDRKDQGLFLRMSVQGNCVAPSLPRFSAAGWMRDAAASRFAEETRVRFNIAAHSAAQPVGTLSGGNQQKVLLAMWTGARPKVLIVDEATRGVDIGAKSEIYAFLRGLAADGIAIVMISSDLLEILGLSDRILVMRGGRIAAEIDPTDATEESIMAAAAGVIVPGGSLQ